MIAKINKELSGGWPQKHSVGKTPKSVQRSRLGDIMVSDLRKNLDGLMLVS